MGGRTSWRVQEFADLLSVVAMAAADNHISKKESEAIRGRWEKLKSLTEGFVQCCEQGNFRKLGEVLAKDDGKSK